MPSESLAGRSFEAGHVRLPDGRTLSYARYGEAGAPAAIYSHGSASCRWEAVTAADHVGRLGFQVIAPDRPGCGGSDWNPGHGQASWAADVAALADALGIGRFAAIGVSAGGPHAVACAALLPGRVTGLVLINTAGDAAHPAWRAVPWRTRLLVRALMLPGVTPLAFRPLRRDPERALRRRPRSEQAAIARHRDWLVPTFREGLRQGLASPLRDARLLYGAPWSVPLDAPAAPIRLFQGRQDPLIGWVREAARLNRRLRLTEIDGAHLDGWTPETWAAAATAAHGTDF